MIALTACGDPPAAPVGAGTAGDPQLGRRTYALCQGCHQVDGAGVPGFAPALRASPLVAGDPAALAAAVLNGVHSADGKYQLPMPGNGPRLTDPEIAALLTWMRAEFATPPAGAVTREQVARWRAALAGRGALTHVELEKLAQRGLP